jgi:hypothetical protein
MEPLTGKGVESDPGAVAERRHVDASERQENFTRAFISRCYDLSGVPPVIMKRKSCSSSLKDRADTFTGPWEFYSVLAIDAHASVI